MPSLSGGLILAPDAVRTVSGSVVIARLNAALWRSAEFMLDVSAAATLAGDTLDVYLQAALDPQNGTSAAAWDDFAHFTQVLGNGGVKRHLAHWAAEGVVPTTAIRAAQDKALATGVLQGPLESSVLRVAWVIAGTGSFTFAVSAYPVSHRGRA